MPSIAADQRAPTYLPTGYRLSHKTPGTAVPRLGGTRDQVTFTYLRTFAVNELPLRLAIANGAHLVLKGTEQRVGERLSLNGGSIMGVYHDGSWSAGSGSDQVELPSGLIHWDRIQYHSLTATVGSESYVVQAPTDISVNELARVVTSIPGLG